MNKEIETIKKKKKNQKEILEQMNTITELKFLLEGINSRLNQKKESMNYKIGDMKLESQRGQERIK